MEKQSIEKQITPEELQEIKNLQAEVQQIALQLGSLDLKKIQLEENVKTLQKREEILAKSLSDKYGVGSLDLDTGKITLLKS